MKKLYIFGDSFSTNYRTLFMSSTNPAKQYYKKEVENGYKGEFQDLQFHFETYFSKVNENVKIINTSFPGNCNSTIFENFCKYSSDFKEGDYISFQLSMVERFRVHNTGGGDPIQISSQHSHEDILKQTNFNSSEIKKILIERTEQLYIDEVINWVNLIKLVCTLTKTKYFIWTIDSILLDQLNLQNIIPMNNTIKDKYPEIDDYHPTFDSYKYIVNNIINYWNDNK